MNTPLRVFLTLFSISSMVVFLTGCKPATPEQTTVAAAEEPKEEEATVVVKLDPAGEKTAGILTESVRYRSVSNSLVVPGIVEAAPDRVAKITPPVSGKVVRLRVRIGEAVQAGQVLAELDSYEVAQSRAAVRAAEARIAEAQATLQTARAEATQAQTLRANAITARDTQGKLARAGAFAEAPLQAARTELADAQSDLLTAQTEQQSHAVLYERTERLFKEGITSKSELEAAQLERQQDTTRVSRATARVESVKQTLAREQRVAQGGLLNRQAIQAAEAEVRAADGERAKAGRLVEAAQIAIQGAQQSLMTARTTLRALVGTGQSEGSAGMVTVITPIAGVISEQSVTIGEAVERSNTLFVVQNLHSVVVEARVPEAEISRVREAQRVEVTVAAFPSKRFTGVVQSMASNVEEKTRTLTARCQVINAGGLLRPEMFAEVHLATGVPRRLLSVPVAAVFKEDGTTFVFVATKDGYQKRAVKMGALAQGFQEITEGVGEGDSIVTNGAYVLRSEARKGELAEE